MVSLKKATLQVHHEGSYVGDILYDINAQKFDLVGWFLVKSSPSFDQFPVR